MSIFEDHFEEYDRWYEKNKNVYLSEVKAIRKALPYGGVGLEIGVGTGRFASSLGIPFGIDPAINMLKLAKQRGINAVAALGEHLPFKDKTFEYALIAITICFVDEPARVIDETRRILKSQGRIIVAIIDRESFLGKKYQKKKSKFYELARFFSVSEIVEMLKDAGFRSFEFFQTIFRSPDEIDTVEETLSGYGKGGFVVISGKKAE